MPIATLNDIVFGKLEDVYKGIYAPKRLWQGHVRLEVFNEPMRVCFETRDDLGIQDFHYKAFDDFKQHQETYKSLALEALLKYYQETIQPLWKDNNYFGGPELTPLVQNPEALENLLSYPSLFLHGSRDGLSSLGLSFECTWDVEHGTGVLLREKKVIDAGQGDVATYDH
jgi:hypothetical protein